MAAPPSCLNRQERDRLLQMFQAIDKTNDGYISFEDVKKDLSMFKDQFSDIMNTFNEIMHMDKDKDGQVSKAEFLSYFENKMSEGVIRDRAATTFRRFDKDNSGKLSRSEIKEMLKEMGISPNSKEVNKMFVMAEKDFDKSIGLEEFTEGIWAYMKRRA